MKGDKNLNVTVTDQENCKKLLRIEIPGDAVRSELDKLAAKYARSVMIAGFRRGHVPVSVVKTRFRKELREEVKAELIPKAFEEAVSENKLKVVGEPRFDELKLGDDDSLNASITVEVLPEFELANYKTIPLRKHVYNVRDEDVEKNIAQLRDAQAELVPVEERGAQDGDILTINITGQVPVAARAEAETEAENGAQGQETAEKPDAETDDAAPVETPEQSSQSEEASAVEGEGSEIEEIKQEDVDIELGGKGVLKEFNEALADVRPGDQRTLTVEYPEEYDNERLAGRTVNYTVDVIAVQIKELPEANDEFAQSVKEEYKTIEDLRADIRSRLEDLARRKSEEELRSAASEQLVDRNRFDVPESVVANQMKTRFNMFIQDLAAHGMDPRGMDLDWESMFETQREGATRDVRRSLILDRIAEAEEIEVSDEELDQEIERLATARNQTAAVLRARLTKEDALDSIKEQVRTRKALDFVIDSAELRTEEVDGLETSAATTGDGDEQAEEGAGS